MTYLKSIVESCKTFINSTNIASAVHSYFDKVTTVDEIFHNIFSYTVQWVSSYDDTNSIIKFSMNSNRALFVLSIPKKL